MGLQLLSPEALAGINERLKRADENILDLDSKINTFLNEITGSGIGKEKRQTPDEWFQACLKAQVPIPLSIIAGEIVHHLRSCLDHIIWDLSAESYRAKDRREIMFPIYRDKPKASSYKPKIKGIIIKFPGRVGDEAIRVIEQLQPYNTIAKGLDPDNAPLAIINELDIIDKHHSLLHLTGTLPINITFPLPRPIVIRPHESQEKFDTAYDAEEAKIEISFQVSFRQFGKGEHEPVIPALKNLHRFVRDVVGLFA